MSGTSTANPDHCVHAIDHIKKLPDADKARALLEELARHVKPILQARGWRVLKLYEICCCTSGGKNLGVGGFCCAAGDKVTSLRIALRLRTPGHGASADEWGAHTLRDFDHCMKILIHEISHIVHGNHSAHFYQLMAELTQQYESVKKCGQVLDAAGMPIVGGRKADESRHNAATMREARQAALRAAEQRAKVGAIMGGGGRLGSGLGNSSVRGGSGCSGGGNAGSSGGSSSSAWRDAAPGVMAARAAEERARTWDAQNGLEIDELEAARASCEPEGDDDSDDEVTEIAHLPPGAAGHGRRRGGSAKARGSAGAISSATTSGSGGGGSSSGGGGSSSGGGGSGGSGGEGCSSSQSSPLARTATAPPSISWGARGQGTWQKVVCPVCGPVCNASMHGPADPPPQDADEGGGDGEEYLRRGDEPNVGTRRELGAAVGGSRESVAGAGTDGAAAVIDLTLSDEDDEEHGGEERHARAKASFDAAKRPRLIPSASVGASEGGRGGGSSAFWRCERCTFAGNESSCRECEVCGTMPAGVAATGCSAATGYAPGAPPGAPPIGQVIPPPMPHGALATWSCAHCTLINKKAATHCAACQQWRYAR